MSSVEFCDSTDANVQRAQDGYNQFNILCPRCSSIVLRKNTAKLANKPDNYLSLCPSSESVFPGTSGSFIGAECDICW
ncbi:unnamed protein product [Schistosoma rodhaini]|nr:unnamed protein product [Schistosoma rodhaini]